MKTVFRNHIVAVSPEGDIQLETICTDIEVCKLVTLQHHGGFYTNWNDMELRGWKIVPVDIHFKKPKFKK